MCGLEFPDLESRIWQPFKDRGVQVIGLSSGLEGLFGGETDAVVERFISQTGITFPVGRDVDFTYWEFDTFAQISPFPLDAIVDQDGNEIPCVDVRSGARSTAIFREN